MKIHDWNEAATSFDQQPAGIITHIPATIRAKPIVIKCRLATWERDEWIEYLLGAHPSQCASVMNRVLNDSTIHQLDGNPNILRQVLNELAVNNGLPDVESAVRRVIERHFPDASSRRMIGSSAFDARAGNIGLDQSDGSDLDPVFTIQQTRLIMHPFVRFLLTVEAAWHDLAENTFLAPSRVSWPRELIMAVAAKVAGAPMIQQRLRDWIHSNRRDLHPLAVSLLHASGASHRRLSELFNPLATRVNLAGAILDDADGTDMSFARCSMQGISFERAQLAEVNFFSTNATNADFSDADLNHAQLNDFIGDDACFAGADLSGSIGEDASFEDADFTLANLANVHFRGCNLCRANLSGADLRRARLVDCALMGARLDDADFTQADLTGAELYQLKLAVADFRQACFRDAEMSCCDLEEMELPDAVFESACLENAVMTHSTMPRANFNKANLRGARLAEIEWESVDLREADLTGATFHMGSSRSGLVGSPLASEGSRTGFYTDELNEQDFKSPEEIRKANLRGADLRGATIDGVDFYLVDLRDARYDPHQAEQFRRTGAILATRPC